MRRKFKFLILGLILFLVAGVIAFQMISTSYTGRNKFDFGGSSTQAGSTSFIQRFIFGNQPVSQYESSSYTGRFGILDDKEISAINVTYPTENLKVIRGSNSIGTEDGKGLVPNTIDLSAKVYINETNTGIPNINVSFYFDDSLISSNFTNSSGTAVLSYDKSGESVGIHNITANYSTSSYLAKENYSTVNFSIIRYVTPTFVGNKGVAMQYVDGQTAILYFNVTIINESGTFFYGPQNISVNATNSAGDPYPDSAYVSGKRVYNTTSGQFENHVVVNKTLGTFIKWNIYLSNNNFVNYIGTSIQEDVGIVDGPICGNSLLETGETCDDGNLVSGDGCSSACASEGTVTPPGGGGTTPPVCTNDCTSGAVETLCTDSKTLRTRTCGNYDADSCTEWGSSSTTNCGAGEICENAQCVAQTCEESSCTGWSECSAGTQTRTCGNALCSISQSCEICEEDWSCEWTICEKGDTLSYPYGCIDENNCGTSENKPTELVDCDEVPEEKYIPINEGDFCSVRWNCSDWGECNADYTFEDILKGATDVNGFKNRVCADLTNCAMNKTEKMPCSLAIPVEIQKTEWCEEDYVEVFEANTGELVSRVKESESTELSDLMRVDISFITSSFTGYCEYCYDGVKNYDETSVDCGGASCPECISIYSFFDWLFWVIVMSWTMLGLFIFILFWKRRKEEKEKVVIKKKSLIRRFFEMFKPATKVEERAKERKISKWFAGLFGKEHRSVYTLKGTSPKTLNEGASKERKKKIRAVKGEIRKRRMINLMRKLRLWKKQGYYGTAHLEEELRNLKNQED